MADYYVQQLQSQLDSTDDPARKKALQDLIDKYEASKTPAATDLGSKLDAAKDPWATPSLSLEDKKPVDIEDPRLVKSQEAKAVPAVGPKGPPAEEAKPAVPTKEPAPQEKPEEQVKTKEVLHRAYSTAGSDPMIAEQIKRLQEVKNNQGELPELVDLPAPPEHSADRAALVQAKKDIEDYYSKAQMFLGVAQLASVVSNMIALYGAARSNIRGATAETAALQKQQGSFDYAGTLNSLIHNKQVELNDIQDQRGDISRKEAGERATWKDKMDFARQKFNAARTEQHDTESELERWKSLDVADKSRRQNEMDRQTDRGEREEDRADTLAARKNAQAAARYQPVAAGFEAASPEKINADLTAAQDALDNAAKEKSPTKRQALERQANDLAAKHGINLNTVETSHKTDITPTFDRTIVREKKDLIEQSREKAVKTAAVAHSAQRKLYGEAIDIIDKIHTDGEESLTPEDKKKLADAEAAGVVIRKGSVVGKSVRGQ